MLIDFIKAFLVGIAASVPIGPVAILIIQKTVTKGFTPGFVTALGSTLVDTLFSVISIFALAFVQEFIEGNSIPIFIVGGLIVLIVGLSMTLSNPFRKLGKKSMVTEGDVTVGDFVTAFLMGLSNPGAIAVMLALMAFFGIAEQRPNDWSFFPVILGVSAGSALYWLAIVFLVDKYRRKFKMTTLIWINRVMGIIVMILGLATFAEGIMRLVMK